MKKVGMILVPATALILAACGDRKGDHAHAKASPPADQGASAHEGNSSMAEESRVGIAVGTIKTKSPTKDSVIIKHGPFQGGISMGAMTMGFGATGNIDLDEFDEGDQVAFRVKLGRDGEYRIMDICHSPDGADDCLGRPQE
ncbi:MAG: copper-binding protein [Parvularcula sp.]